MAVIGSRETGRLIAFLSLYQFDTTDKSVEELKDFEWYLGFVAHDDENGLLPGVTKRAQKEVFEFAHDLFLGVIGNLARVDEIISRYLVDWDFSRLKSTDKAVLRLSVYSLLYCQDIPAEVEIFQANGMATAFGDDEAYRYINGILHQVKTEFRRNFVLSPKKKPFKLKRKKK